MTLQIQRRKLLAATMLISGFLALPVLSQTAPGTSIKNTATATYSDGTTSFTATSNTVSIDVAEVAGITLVAQPPSNPAPAPGTTVTVPFIITNKGNDPTTFQIPGIATLSDNTNSFTVTQIRITDVNGTSQNITVPLGATTVQTPSVPPGGTVKVEVTISTSTTPPTGATTTVTLGKTTPVTLQSGVPYVADSGSVYTKDNTNAATVAGEFAGELPITSEKEAMDTSAAITISGRLQAFATVLKANSAHNNNDTPGTLSDDTLTYELALRVENPASPPSGLVVSDLHATQINLDSGSGLTQQNKILVSDVIPTDTQLSTATPTAPTGWTPVYSTGSTSVNPLLVNWTTTRPTSGTITRVGFIADGPIVKGTPTIRDFKFSVNPLASFTGGQIANIAQVFGQSQPGTATAGTATQIVYDESGDQTYNNGLEGTNPDPATNGGITPGVANPTIDGTDPGTGSDPTNATTNQGTDTGATAGTKTIGGEDTVFTIAATPLNGPNNQPAAVGPTNNNDDFTNRAVSPPAGLNPATLLTDAQTPVVNFTNTLQNTSGSPQTISLIPIAPIVKTDLPDSTTVTIDPDGTGPGTAITFTYNQTTGAFTPSGPIPSVLVPASGNASYSVAINLGNDAAQNTGYSVPITAFIDTDKNGQYDPTKDPSNTTIDRVYTGYVTLLKEARILEDADNNPATAPTPVSGNAGSFTTIQADLSAAATPGRFIEYRITYKNISNAQGSGSNNGLLNANDLTIKEDGLGVINTTPGNSNNWFTYTKDPLYPGVAKGTAADSLNPGQTTITVILNGADIQTYTNTLPPIAPQVTGAFTFYRQIK
jgi:hypothetical protein